jgi:hypothetical protein
MTQNKMAPEFPACYQGLLEVYARAFSQSGPAVRPKGRLTNRFAGKISRKIIFVYGNDCEAASVHGDAVRYSELGRERWCLNSDAPTLSLQ